MHVAAVPPDRDPSEPVRTFGTCTSDLQRLADWFERNRCSAPTFSSSGVAVVSPLVV